MEILIIVPIILLCVVVVLIYSWNILNWVWLRPKKWEKIMKAQGFNGNPYTLLHGDFKEIAKVTQQANSKPISLYDDIIPRSVPFLYHIQQKYGSKSFHWMGPQLRVYLTDSQQVKEVLSKHFQFLKNETHPLNPYLISGIVSYEGTKWSKHRKLLNPAFHMEKLKLMLPAFYLSCMETISKWEDIVDAAKGACELDVWPYLQAVTSDAISRTAFGSSYEEGRKVFEIQTEQIELVVSGMRSLYLPGMRFLPTKRNRRIKANAKEVDAIITGLINKRINDMKAGKARANDLLGILLESNLKAIEDQGKESSYMSTHDIIEECKLFYFAGQETTSTLLVWTMVLLCKHPEWQERAREEVLKEFGYETPGFEDLNRLKIMTMILYEVLRMYPPIPSLGRRAGKEMKLGNITIPAGAHLELPFIFLHYDPALWGSDVNEFKPERFSEGVLKATKGNASFFPFGGGPRVCIGQNFAMMEAKITLSMILQRFSFELSPSYAHAPYNLLSLQPHYGAQFILHKI